MNMRCFAVLFVALVGSASAQQPVRLSAPGVSPAVWGVVEIPRGPGPHPGLILLPGSAGWRASYPQLARVFADSGFVTLALDYFGETGRDTSREDAARKRPIWQQTIKNAVAYLQTSEVTPARPIGLIGFSRGGFLAVAVAASTPGVAVVVDFSSGGAPDPDSLKQEVRGFPPLLILHGEADSVVLVQQAYRLRDAVRAQGGTLETRIYPGAQHGFNMRGTTAYSEAAAQDAWFCALQFLRRHLEQNESTLPCDSRYLRDS